ncbi:MAG: CBS domain-containing protein [Thioalkalispiraceae bacterium]|jgi:CBS domain-containing protein
MSAGEYCNREVVVVTRSESVREAVNLMRKYHVGTVVVVDLPGKSAQPIGILTDRDIVIEILAENVDIDSVSIEDVMSFDLVTVPEDTKLLDAVSLMREKGVRRIPVVSNEGYLVGLLSVDDVIELLSEEISNIAKLISAEQRKERTLRN